MLLGRERICGLVKDGVLENAIEDNIDQVSYDLTTRYFFIGKNKHSFYSLMPGDSVFVESKEIIHLPSDIACRVIIKNSRIRQGLRLDAPLYFPGHETRLYFRITNVSSDQIDLDTEKGIAAVCFETVEGPTGDLYSGAFADEFDFRGMGSYESLYGAEIKKLDKKSDEVLGIERRMYANVVTLMGIFVGLFSLLNVNLMSIAGGMDTAYIVAINLATVASLAFMFALISLVAKNGRGTVVALFAAAVVAFIASLAWISFV